MPVFAFINGTSRTLSCLMTQCLSEPNPPEIRAIVRSEPRFLAKLQLPASASGKVPSCLSVHEYSDYANPIPLIPILKGVDTVFVALGINDNRPTTLNQDVLQSIVSVLAASKSEKETRSPTKVVLLGAYHTTPTKMSRYRNGQSSFMEKMLHDTLLANQYTDLARAAAFLERQGHWLDFIIMSPDMIVDDLSQDEFDSSKADFTFVVESPGVAASKDLVEPLPTSYTRLARAFLTATRNPSFIGKYVIPMPNGRKVERDWQATQTQREVIGHFVMAELLPAAAMWMVFGIVCTAAGYTYGVGI